jgi:hypothetical protein
MHIGDVTRNITHNMSQTCILLDTHASRWTSTSALRPATLQQPGESAVPLLDTVISP